MLVCVYTESRLTVTHPFTLLDNSLPYHIQERWNSLSQPHELDDIVAFLAEHVDHVETNESPYRFYASAAYQRVGVAWHYCLTFYDADRNLLPLTPDDQQNIARRVNELAAQRTKP